jgi:Uma2 family endonuclease
MLGPLINPSNPQKQLVGVFSLELARLYNYLYQQTDKKYLILHTLSGYDEISLTGDFKIITPKIEAILSPKNLKMSVLQPTDLSGGDTLQDSADIFLNVLQNNGTAAQTQVVVANAAFALQAANPVLSIADAIATAQESLQSRRAWACFKMKLANLSFRKTYSYADYLQWTFEEQVELIKGKLFKMSPAPTTLHQRTTGYIFYRLYDLLKNKKCQVFDAPFDVRLAPRTNETEDKIFTVVQPDVCVICDLEKLDEKGCVGAPDLIVEVLSPGNSQREMRDKYEVYEENGVKEYWIVQPLEKIVLVYVLNDSGKYIGLKPMTEKDVLTSDLFPKLKIKVKDIFK